MPLLFIPVVMAKRTHFALLDSGASDSFDSLDVVQQAGLRLLPLKETIKVRVANGQTLNVQHFVRVHAAIGDLKLKLFLRVISTPLPIVLGYPFLHQFNPMIDWKNRTVIITLGKKTHTIPVVKAYGTPHQPMSVDAVADVQAVLSNAPPGPADAVTDEAVHLEQPCNAHTLSPPCTGDPPLCTRDPPLWEKTHHRSSSWPSKLFS